MQTTEENIQTEALLETINIRSATSEIRKLGGAIFCDRRYDHVFVYHNGAESYYGVRGFRGSIRV